MTEEIAKIKANKDGTYIDIVPEKCVSAQKAQYDENGRDLLDAESSQTIKGANTFAAKQTLTGGIAVSGTSAISGNVNLDSGAVAIGSAVTVENHGKITADNTSNSLKVADHDSVLTGNDVLNANDIMTANGDANNLLHRNGNESKDGLLDFIGTSVPRIHLNFIPSSSTSTSDSSGWRDLMVFIANDGSTIGSLRLVRMDKVQKLEFVTVNISGSETYTPIIQKTIET